MLKLLLFPVDCLLIGWLVGASDPWEWFGVVLVAGWCSFSLLVRANRC